MPVRTGSINTSGVIPEAKWFGATSDFNLSLAYDATVPAVATIVLERRFNDPAADTLPNQGDRLLQIGGDEILLLQGGNLFTISSASASGGGGFRACDSFTASFEGIVEVAGPTEFRLNCTSFGAGPIEFRLG